MKHIGYVALFLVVVGCCSSSSTLRQSKTKDGHVNAIDTENLKPIAFAIAKAMAGGDDPTRFEDMELFVLRSYRFVDNQLLAHPRHYDKVYDVQNRQLERFYLDYEGKVVRSEIREVSDQEFWKPLLLLAEYYAITRALPPGPELSTAMLSHLVRRARKSIE